MLFNKKFLGLALACSLGAASAQTNAATLVAYYSATGNTAAVAKTIAGEIGADLYEIVPTQIYSDADLNWRDDNSRSSKEHQDPSIRPTIASTVDLSKYDTVLIGYPIWWGEAPNIVYTFVENSNFAGKTVACFATSTSSRLANSADNVTAAMKGDIKTLDSIRFEEHPDASDVSAWLSEIGLKK